MTGRSAQLRSENGDGLLTNAAIAELLAVAADSAQMPLQKALRRASRKAFLWEEEAGLMVKEGRSLTELPAIGPHLNRLIREWMEHPPTVPERPDTREGFLTLTEARALLASKPDWATNLKGDLQMHTLWSDGSGSIEEMARSAASRGYEYISITDHSKGLKIAGGIDEEQLLQQGKEVQAVNSTLRAEGLEVQVLHSVELNLDPSGRGDMDRDALKHLDLVLGCFHSALRKKEDQTERYVAALNNPDIQILGHPRGRVYNFRVGLKADWKRVMGVAAELDKAIEIDAYPDRQDLSPDLVEIAKETDCRISLGTDSHDPLQLRFMEYGLASALRAGVNRDRVLNFMTAKQLRDWVSNVRSQSRRTATVI